MHQFSDCNPRTTHKKPKPTERTIYRIEMQNAKKELLKYIEIKVVKNNDKA